MSLIFDLGQERRKEMREQREEKLEKWFGLPKCLGKAKRER